MTIKSKDYFSDDSYPYRVTINEYQKLTENQQSIINSQNKTIKQLQESLNTSNRAAEKANNELRKVLNSRGWRTLEKVRTILPTHRNIINNSSPKTIHESPTPNKKYVSYSSHFEENIDYSQLGYKPEVKAITFYLPQFHTFPENDNWWGKGFTEWTNTKKSQPRFEGHYQPREPHSDIGYYKLDNVNTIKKQVILAKQHGIYGFCFYYYWFSGKKLMQKPIDIFLKNKDINYPFCLCWANENWTRTWDGLNKNILIQQNYEPSDPALFIKDLKKYILDPRYIKVDGKPILLVYSPDSIPDFPHVVELWREEAKKIGIGEILIWSKSSIFDHDYKNISAVDAEFDFAPTGCTFRNSFIEENNEHTILDYKKLVQDYNKRQLYYYHFPIKPFYYSCTMGWDNAARRQSGYCTLINYNPKSFYDWIRLIIEETKRRFPPNKRFMFINAWNEWAEGTYLEPDKKYGYTNINTAAKAIYGIPYQEKSTNNIIIDNHFQTKPTSFKIALQIHAFYPEILNEIFIILEKSKLKIDLFISTDSEAKKEQIKTVLNKYHLKAVKLEIIKNIGRDVYPFIKQMSKTYKKYDIIGHLHTKKTPQSFYGDAWRHHLYHNLIGSPNYLEKIMTIFKDPDIGLVIPTYFYMIKNSVSIGSNLLLINELLRKAKLKEITKKEHLIFPAGTMFWAKTKAIKNLFEINLSEKDFQTEKNQVDGTTAHAIERLIGVMTKQNSYKTISVINKT